MEKKANDDEFAASCRPLSELLDSVRNIEGFPIGKDEDILALSDPPYYTACPNPYLNEFIKKYGKPYDEKTDKYECTPFVSDVSEGKKDPIYNAHSYHTKVPHKAIIKFIEHYTKAGDIIFDGFCGTGMTGIASEITDRKALLIDISTAATFISNSYVMSVNIQDFEKEIKNILNEVEKECSWMYETIHADGKSKGTVNYTIWSDVFICPYCKNEYIFWDASVDQEDASVSDNYECPHCKAGITKRECRRAELSFFDSSINSQIVQAKQVPVLINYSVDKKEYEKLPDKSDLALINKIESSTIPYWFPINRMPEGDESRRNDKIGITHVHHFYTKRNLWALAAFFAKVRKTRVGIKEKSLLMTVMTGGLLGLTKLQRYRPKSTFPNMILSGTLYIGSIEREWNAYQWLRGKLKGILRSRKNNVFSKGCIVSCNSTNEVHISNNSMDYIFTDPPFGNNLMYSELNFLWESWLKVFSNNNSEAIMNNTQKKGLYEYKALMTLCFKEMYRILKPNRWITVVFHNSKASIWNAIQDSLAKAGFIIAQVTVMDKKQGSFKQVTSAGAVKNDLIINAYKPKQRFEEYFLKRAGESLERDFVEEHLNHLPIEINIERTEQMLFSKMIAHYIQRGFEIRLNARQFYTLLRDNFKLIDGYWFTDSQILKYEEWKKKSGLAGIKEIKSGQQVLFVNNERSAVIWLYNFLETPQTYSDIYTAYTKAVSNVEDQIPEIKELLGNNFIFEGKSYRRPKTEKEQEEIEEQREKDLSRAFERILAEAKTTGKKIKEIRKEAVAHGFTKAYQEKRFADIVAVAKKLDKKILEENSEINDFVEIAQLKLGVDL